MNLEHEVQMLWSALDKTNRQVDALGRRGPAQIPVVTPLAQHCPAPDYRITEPAGTAGGTWPPKRDPEPCSCDEALALQALLGRVRAALDEAYKLPNRAALREYAWRYLDLIRDEIADVDAQAKEETNQIHR